MRSHSALLGSALVMAACSNPEPAGSTASCGMTTTFSVGGTDRDRDGLDDAQEIGWAQRYLPYLSLSVDDDCAVHGIVVRVSPHPAGRGLVQIRYDVLYDQDCGALGTGITGHVGDDERFAMTIDPSVPPPNGILAIKAISHRGTQCEMPTECGRCGGLAPCETRVVGGVPMPAVWVARDKHGNYVNRSTTCLFSAANVCGDICDDSETPDRPPIVNVGEPCHPLVDDLTTVGFVTTENGWTHTVLFHYDPWGGQPFGEGSVIADDLTDLAFDTPACP